MVRNVLVCLIVAVFLIAGSNLWAQARGKAAPPNAPDIQCTLSGQGDFSIGWSQPHQGSTYRCLPIFDESLKPAGAAWVKVEADGTIGRIVPR